MKITYLTLLISLLFISEVYAQRKLILELSDRTYKYKTDYSRDTILALPNEVLLERENKLFNELQKRNRSLNSTHDLFGIYIDFTKAYFKDEATFTNSIFKCDVVFNSAIFNEDAFFTATRFEESAHFYKTIFRKQASLKHIDCNGVMSFYGTHFLDKTDFGYSKFSEMCLLNNVLFERQVSFIGCKFSYASFDGVNFNANADFYNIEVDDLDRLGGLSFDSSIFKGIVRFHNATINQDIGFNAAFFKSTLSLQNASFRQRIDFTGTRINSVLNLSAITLYDSAKIFFLNTVLPDTINLSCVPKIPNEIDLIVANFKDSTRYNKKDRSYKYHYINLYKTDITKLHIDYTHFRLLLTDPETNQTLPSDECKAQYEALLKNFKDRGQMDSYELLDIEYHDYKWKQRNALISWWRYVCKSWYMYGYERERIFLWTIGLIAFFTCITFWRLDTLSRDVYPFSNMHSLPTLQNIKEYKLGYKAYKTRLWYSFIYTSAIFFLFWLKIEKLQYHKKGDLLYLMVAYIMGIVCLAYIANYIIQK